jgi:ATP-dependent Clp protease adaptor protein ClpS
MKFMATKPPSPPPAPRTPSRDEGGSVVLERRTQKTQPPQMYQVVMLNDDYTQIMLKIHLDGKGVCGVYTRDVAATKVEQVLDAAHKAGHPLQCISEPVE